MSHDLANSNIREGLSLWQLSTIILYGTMKTTRLLLSLLFALLSGLVMAEAPIPGTYIFDLRHYELRIVLTNAKGNDFTVSGNVGTAKVKGILHGKSGQMRATLGDKGDLNYQQLNGYWDFKKGELVLMTGAAKGMSTKPAGYSKETPSVGSGRFGLVSKVLGHDGGTVENEGTKITSTMSERSYSVTITKKAPWEGTATVTLNWSGGLGSDLKPRDVVELTCSSTASHSGKDMPALGSDCKWVVSGSVKILEYEKFFAGDGSSGFIPVGSGKTRFKVLTGGTITISAEHLGAIYGKSDNWVPCKYTYKFNAKPTVGG